MPPNTTLEPIPKARAEEIRRLLEQASGAERSGLSIGEGGRLLGLVPVDDPYADHVLGDFDVHA